MKDGRVNNLNWKIGGQAGYGILSAGEIFAYSCLRGGLETFAYLEYPSLIRGGHNTYQVWVREDNVQSHSSQIDLLVALNKETIYRHITEVTKGGVLIYDTDDKFLNEWVCPRQDITCFGVPLGSLAEKAGGQKMMSNVAGVAASFALVKYPFDLIEEFVTRAFKKKGDEVADINLEVARVAYEHAIKYFTGKFVCELKPKKVKEKRMLINGNEAIAIGAIKAGMKFFAAYPMTPASSILHYLASQERNYSIVVKQTEDEISAMNMIAGAGFTGVRAMTATSGGGFALMSEALGLVGMVESPVVIALVQRPGPATGLPTWTEQGDLRFAMHAGQGDSPRVILAPGDPAECFYMTFEAFNIAEKYQLPVIILSDKYLAEARQSIPFFDTDKLKIERGDIVNSINQSEYDRFDRYADSTTGVSARTLPGTVGGIFTANSDEHDATGLAEESAENRKIMMDKRMRKLQLLKNGIKDAVKLYGPKNADVTIVGWGSVKGPILEAMKMVESKSKSKGKNLRVNFLQIRLLNPFPVKEVDAILRQAKHRILIENNFSGQLGGLIREKTGIDITDKLLKYDGRPIHPEEVVSNMIKFNS
ncbi:MAG: 2-oxoacid:acceptor oxidoreductase subunit alpha [Patescibacteria group bacterium]